MWYVHRKPIVTTVNRNLVEKPIVCFVNARTKYEALQVFRENFAYISLKEIERVSFPIVVPRKRGETLLFTPKHYIEYFKRKGKYASGYNLIMYNELDKNTASRIKETI